MDFKDVIGRTAEAVEIAGVLAILAGVVVATSLAASMALRGGKGEETYKTYRRRLGRSVLLGLELLVAADIIRTVAVTPTFDSVGVLALIIVVRTFLSFSLELEISGRWPWQKATPAERTVTQD
ncbi:DUF1622 domain-containing protein [Arthrobacter sp. TMN-50]